MIKLSLIKGVNVMGAIYMAICPKCANFKANRVCKFCNEQMIPTEIEIGESMKMTDKQEKELIEHYIQTLIKDTYDPEARAYREKNQKSAFADYVPNNQLKCPTCGSTNIQKITGLERGISVATLGLFSKKINKSFKCNHCGYTW